MLDVKEWEDFIKTVTPLKNCTFIPFKPVLTSPKKKIPPPPEERLKRSTFTVRHYMAHEVSRIIGPFLDLHGLTLDYVEGALLRFLRGKSGWVLIITGKGQILRKWFINWAKTHPEYVVGFAQALPKHGGEGAFYLHVRKLR